MFKLVVYLLIPTSNHNSPLFRYVFIWLYIFWFLHQTTTIYSVVRGLRELYIFWFLHQTTTLGIKQVKRFGCISFDSYIKPQLFWCIIIISVGCISFDSYIKPQHLGIGSKPSKGCISFDSYIKPQLVAYICCTLSGCISFDSYIKPQPSASLWCEAKVVYLLITTSNHNL